MTMTRHAHAFLVGILSLIIIAGCQTSRNHALSSAQQATIETEVEDFLVHYREVFNAVDTDAILNPHLPGAGAMRFPVPYTNYYPVNGALIVPMLGRAEDEKAEQLLRKLHPGREIVGVPSTALAVSTRALPSGSIA